MRSIIPSIGSLVLLAALATGIVLTDMPAAAAQTGSAYEAGLRVAKRRHVANPRCYAQVFESYAVLNRNARWRWPSGGRRTARVQQVYQQELFQRCGVA